MRTAVFMTATASLLASAAFAQDMGHGEDPAPTIFQNIRIEGDYAPTKEGLFTWDVDGWIGGDTERIWLRAEGEVEDGIVGDAEAQIYYGWNVDPFWDVLVGVRQDFEPESTTYLAASIVGLAKYDFETEGTIFLSDRGDLSARFSQSFDILLTQRLIAQPYAQLDVYAQDLPELNIGAGLSEVEVGLQLRYEITRKFAPYIDAVWQRKVGESSGLARAAGEDAEQSSIRFGLRVWF
jgi:copper resistance protein B